MSVRSDRRLSRQDLASSGVLWPATVIFSSRRDLSSWVRNMALFAQTSNVGTSRIHSNEQVNWLMWMVDPVGIGSRLRPRLRRGPGTLKYACPKAKGAAYLPKAALPH